MNAPTARLSLLTLGLVVAMAATVSSVSAQTKIKPGFNLFSVDQDQEIGKKSAAEADRQLPILNDRSVEAYVNAIGKRLAAAIPGAKYPYQFKIVNASDINAFALPGGYMYLNRGLIEAAKNEGQLAGVMAHEMSHVALRHGTNQASKATLAQMGLGVMGGLVGKGSNSTAQAVNAIGGFGLNTLFLKFSRTDEEQADVVGAQTMARAGYDPKDMVDFFEMLRATEAHDPGKVEQFFSTHPAPKDRAARIRNEMKSLTIRPTAPVGGLKDVQATLRSKGPAKTTQQIMQAQAKSSPAPRQGFADEGNRVAAVEVKPPSPTFRSFEQRTGFFRVDYPENWRVYQPSTGYGVTLAPQGGFVDTGAPEQNLVYGVVINHYDPIDQEAATGDQGSADRFGGSGFNVDQNGESVSRTDLAVATNDLITQILRSNPNLKPVPGSQRSDTLSGWPALRLTLSGPSDVTGREERVTVFTRGLSDNDVIYALFIAPGQDYADLAPTFEHIISSLDVNDKAAHR